MLIAFQNFSQVGKTCREIDELQSYYDSQRQEEDAMGTPKLPSWKEKHSLISRPLAKVPTVWVEGPRNITVLVNRKSGCTNWTSYGQFQLARALFSKKGKQVK